MCKILLQLCPPEMMLWFGMVGGGPVDPLSGLVRLYADKNLKKLRKKALVAQIVHLILWGSLCFGQSRWCPMAPHLWVILQWVLVMLSTIGMGSTKGLWLDLCVLLQVFGRLASNSPSVKMVYLRRSNCSPEPCFRQFAHCTPVPSSTDLWKLK